jgi:glycosyltransferase involved in cell wall biosynthesis
MKEKTEDLAPKNPIAIDRPVKAQKILYIITKSNFGGAQRYVFELARRAKYDGYEVAVALGGRGVLKEKLEAEGIRVFPLTDAARDIHLTKEFLLLVRLYKTIREFKPQVLHLNSPKIGGLGAVAGRCLSVPHIVYTNHGWPFKEDRPLWQVLLIKFFSWLTVFFNKKVIVLSKTEFALVERWPTARKKLEIIPNGLSSFDTLSREQALTTLLHRGRDSTEKVLVPEKGTLVIGTISELHKNKGLSYAIEGFRLFVDQNPNKKSIFIIIGEGEERKKLQQQITDAHLEKSIFLVGHIDNARSYLRAFDTFLLSSIKEGLPYVILEAGFASIPVISTSVGGIPEIIRNFETGLLIPAKRPQEIKNALIYAEEHPELIQQTTQNLQKVLLEKFDFETIYKETVRFYFKA